MTVKSIFVPESYLREEIRVGYDQKGGDEPEDTTPVIQFKEPEEPAKTEESDEPVSQAEAEPQPEETKGADEFLPDEEPVDEEPEAVAEPEAEGTELFDSLTKDDAEPTFDSLAALEGPTPADPTTGGGLFDDNSFTTVLQTLMMSGNGMPVADILEDGVYELNAIKSYMDSIAQSLATIADKMSGGWNNNNNNKRDRGNNGDRGNKPWERRNNKQQQNERPEWRDDAGDVQEEEVELEE